MTRSLMATRLPPAVMVAAPAAPVGGGLPGLRQLDVERERLRERHALRSRDGYRARAGGRQALPVQVERLDRLGRLLEREVEAPRVARRLDGREPPEGRRLADRPEEAPPQRVGEVLPPVR